MVLLWDVQMHMKGACLVEQHRVASMRAQGLHRQLYYSRPATSCLHPFWCLGYKLSLTGYMSRVRNKGRLLPLSHVAGWST